MNRSLASSRAARLAAESMPAPGDNDEVLDTVGGLEGLHDGDDRGGLSLVALPAADLEREAGPVDQQAHDDLGVDPPLLGVTHPPQVVLTLGLEVEGGDVVQAQGQTPTGGDVIEQGPRQALAVAPLPAVSQGAEQGPHADRPRPRSPRTRGTWALQVVGSIRHARTIYSKARSPPVASPSPRQV